MSLARPVVLSGGRAAGFALGSALLLALSFPLPGWWPLAWGAFVPWFAALRGRSPAQGFYLGGLFGAGFFLATLYWVADTIHRYGHQPYGVGLSVLLLLILYLSLYPALFGALLCVAERRDLPLWVTAPVLWTSLEWLRAHLFTGFPWASLGYSQAGVLPIIQIADLAGVYGIGALLVLVNALLFEILLTPSRWPRKALPAGVGILAVGAALLYGAWRLQTYDAPLTPHASRLTPPGPTGPAADRDKTIRIALIQGNIDQAVKWNPGRQREVLETYLNLTRQAVAPNPQGGPAKRPDLIIWPETATPFFFNRHSAYAGEITALTREVGAPLLFGSPTRDTDGSGTVRLSNSAYLLSPTGQIVSRYDKMHLVPFGEYVPLQRLLFFVGRMVEAISDFRAGEAHVVAPFNGGKLATVICYEIIFPHLVREFVREGANLMTTITNDAWFGRSSAPYQHFGMAVLRAVEHRIPVARAANTGISGLIAPSGRVLVASPIFEGGIWQGEVALRKETTLYTRVGDLFAYLCMGGSVILLGYGLIRKHKGSAG
ncbi:MAG: apolipoprotein N-acyltransferase [Nitrospirae bacterium]|nr:apolipoprotein N-acyltransferase [Nitrospirota bacterium]